MLYLVLGGMVYLFEYERFVYLFEYERWVIKMIYINFIFSNVLYILNK